MNTLMILLLVCILLVVLFLLKIHVNEHFSFYRVVYKNGVYISQKRVDCSNAGGVDWVEWHDDQEHETVKDAVSYIKGLSQDIKSKNNKSKINVIGYYFK